MRLTVASSLKRRGFSPKTYIFKIENLQGQPREFAEDIGSRIYRDTDVDAYIEPFSVHETTIIQEYGANRARILLPAIYALKDKVKVIDGFGGFFLFTENEASNYLQTIIFVVANGAILSETGHIQNNNANGNCTYYIVSDVNLEAMDWEPIKNLKLISKFDYPPKNGHES